MKKFVITEQDRKHILSRHGLLNEQVPPEEIKQGTGTDPYQYKKVGDNKFFYAFKKEGDKPYWIQSKILKGVNAISQNIFKGPEIAKDQAELDKLYTPTGTQSNVTTTTTTIASGAGSGLSGTGSAGAAAAGGGASTTTSQQKQYGQPGQVTDKFGTRPNISGIQNTQTTTQQGKDTLSNQTTQTNTTQQPVQYSIKDLKDLLKQKGFKVGSDENKLGKMTLAAIENALSKKQ